MASIDDLQRIKRKLEDLKQDLNNYSNGLPSWKGTAKDNFVKMIEDINSSSNSYSLSKIIKSINSFIFNYNKHN